MEIQGSIKKVTVEEGGHVKVNLEAALTSKKIEALADMVGFNGIRITLTDPRIRMELDTGEGDQG